MVVRQSVWLKEAEGEIPHPLFNVFHFQEKSSAGIIYLVKIGLVLQDLLKHFDDSLPNAHTFVSQSFLQVASVSTPSQSEQVGMQSLYLEHGVV